jgi:hypothetical protein
MLFILFTISFIFSYVINNEIFSFQENRVLFVFSNDYFHKFAFRPGGLLEYAGNFITQGYYYEVIGSLILSSFIILQFIIFQVLNKRLSVDGSSMLIFVLIPVLMLLIIQNSFTHFSHYSLGYLTAVSYFLFFVLCNKKRHGFVFLVLIPLVFYVIGFFTFVCTGMFITYLIINEKGLLRYFLPVLLVLYVLIIILVFKEVVFFQPYRALLFYPFINPGRTELPALLLILIGYTVLSPWFLKSMFFKKLCLRYSGLNNFAIFLSIPLVAALLLNRQNNSSLARLTYLEKSVYALDWDRIIRQQEACSSKSLTEQYLYFLALANKNTLCERLFFANYSFGAESLTLPHKDEYLNLSVYFYYTIGLISEAHHLAYESMVKFGYQPGTIKMLVKTDLINGNYRVAERYINILKKTIHYRNWATNYEKLLYNPALISSDPDLGEKIRMLPPKDFFIRPDDFQNIELFLMSNPQNKRAFEYKIARLLLQKDITPIVYEIKNMKTMGYSSIPRYIEEAILIYSNSKESLPDLGGLAVSTETEMRFVQFNKTLALHKDEDKLRLKREMKDKWGNTFWYYYRFE